MVWFTYHLHLKNHECEKIAILLIAILLFNARKCRECIERNQRQFKHDFCIIGMFLLSM